MNKKVLIVVAHPDDEILGCGGTIASLSKEVEFYSCILSGKVDARANRPELNELHEDIVNAQKLIGIKESVLGDFPNIKFNTVPHIEMVNYIENEILRIRPNYIFTHHPGDLNLDHYYTSISCQAASRIIQRKANLSEIMGLYYMEILSSTDWGFPGNNNTFLPDTFIEIGKENIEKKIESLKLYRGIMRDFPHPRSNEVLRGLAAFRGGQSGLMYAESFQTAYHKLEI